MPVTALRRTVVPALLAVLALAACDAKAQTIVVPATTAFDGKWQFDMTFTGDAMCAFEGLPLVVRLREGQAQGLYSEPNYGGWTYSAAVTDAGALEMVMGGYAIVRFSGTLSGDSGKGDIDVRGTSLSCGGDWTARKLPDAL